METSERLCRIRVLLGLSQRNMAVLLDMSRALLAYIELGKRSEPPSIKKQLDEFSPLLFTKSATTKQQLAIKNTGGKDLTKRIAKELKSTELRLMKEEKAAKGAYSTYEKTVIAMHAAQTLMDNAASQNKKPHPILKQHIYKLEKKLQQCDVAKQELINARIEGLKAEVAYLSNIVSA